MDSKTMFILTVLFITIAALAYNFRSPLRMIEYFKTKEGKKVLAGIVIFVVSAVASVAVFADKPKYFAYGEVFIGIDHTFKLSPQCRPDAKNSDKLTSNGGFRVNLVQSNDKRFEFNAKYTHHSCAFSSDRNTYDAIGFEATYKLFER